VVNPFPIACGNCLLCKEELFSLCENSNTNAWLAEKMWGYSICGVYGYSHLLGGYAGGQAEYARVPFADVGPIKVPDELPDEKVLFLSDVFPTGYMAAENCNIRPGDTIAVWGCGPVGQFAIKSAYLLGAERVIAIDRYAYRLRIARERAGAETLNDEEVDVYEALREMTGGRGPDACIDAVGMEAHAPGVVDVYDRVKTALPAARTGSCLLTFRVYFLSSRAGCQLSLARRSPSTPRSCSRLRKVNGGGMDRANWCSRYWYTPV
jgi:threonine dehydrogenase-like Zn-dependent dehydrogenase